MTPPIVTFVIAATIAVWSILASSWMLMFTRDPTWTQEYSQGRTELVTPDGRFRFGDTFEFLAVSDLDKASRHPEQFQWRSIIKFGVIRRTHVGKTPKDDRFTVELVGETQATTSMATNNRSLELSDIVWWNDGYYTVCDYTGVVYALRPSTGAVFPRFVLADGDGHSSRTLKGEWMTVYGDHMYIGSHGKEWTDNGQIIARGAEWVKVIDRMGRIFSVDWGPRYQMLRKATNMSYPGYMSHEAVLWHEPAKLWVFLPRKCSQNIPFDDILDETLGCNLLILVNEDFTKVVDVRTVGPHEPDFGFSSIARLPGSSLMIATKSKEVGSHAETKLTIFDLEGNIYMDPPFFHLGNIKYEGIEFLAHVDATN